MDPAGIYRVSYEQDMAIIRTKIQWRILVGAIIALFLGPFYLPLSMINVISLTSTTLITALGLQILTGCAGQISIGTAVFFGVGAYASAILVNNFQVPFLISVFLSGSITAFVGAIFGIPSLRLKGFYLVMATLAGHSIIFYVFSHIDYTGGQIGLKASFPTIGPIFFDNSKKIFWLHVSFLILFTYFARNITRSKWGRAFIAVRDNDLAANVMGINVWQVKIVAFSTGCFFAGVGGALYAHFTGFVHPNQFPILSAIWYLGYLIVGGLGSITGCYFGVILIVFINEMILRLPVGMEMAEYIQPMTDVVFGILIILILIFDPKGLYHRWELFKSYYRIWPLAYK